MEKLHQILLLFTQKKKICRMTILHKNLRKKSSLKKKKKKKNDQEQEERYPVIQMIAMM